MSTYNELCQAMATRKTIRLAVPNMEPVTGTVQSIGYDGTPGFYFIVILGTDGKLHNRTIQTKLFDKP